MAFMKTGDSQITAVMCSCGANISGNTDHCVKCGKTLIAKNMQTKPEKNVQEDKDDASQVK